MTDAQELNITKRDTMLTAKRRARLVVTSNFSGYLTDTSDNHFVDTSDNHLMSISAINSPNYTIVQRDTMLTRKDREDA